MSTYAASMSIIAAHARSETRVGVVALQAAGVDGFDVAFLSDSEIFESFIFQRFS